MHASILTTTSPVDKVKLREYTKSIDFYGNVTLKHTVDWLVNINTDIDIDLPRARNEKCPSTNSKLTAFVLFCIDLYAVHKGL